MHASESLRSWMNYITHSDMIMEIVLEVIIKCVATEHCFKQLNVEYSVYLVEGLD